MNNQNNPTLPPAQRPLTLLLCGARGFIGRHIAQALTAQGHRVVEGRSQDMDFTRDLTPAAWRPRLSGADGVVDVVVNAVGVLRDTRRRPMDAVHHLAPAALFQACADLGVRRVIQVSALGVEGNATRYASTKRAADDALLRLIRQGRLDGTVLRPSIVFGRGGASTQLFMNLARLPLLVLPGAALRAQVQPVAVRDLAQACARLATQPGPELLQAVGPQPLVLADFIASLRQQLGHGRALRLGLPEWLSRLSARVGDQLSMQPWCSETLALLQQDNTADPTPFQALLGRPATAAHQLVEAAWQAA